MKAHLKVYKLARDADIRCAQNERASASPPNTGSLGVHWGILSPGPLALGFHSPL